MRDNPEVQALMERLVRAMAEAEATVARLEEPDRDQRSGHPCEMVGSVRKLLVHSIAHDRTHAGQVHEKRWALDGMQEGDLPRLQAEMVRARAELITALIDLPDAALYQVAEKSATPASIREVMSTFSFGSRARWSRRENCLLLRGQPGSAVSRGPFLYQSRRFKASSAA